MSIFNSESLLGNSQGTRKFRVSLVGDTAWLSVAEVFAITLGLLSQVVLTRGLITDEYGIWIVIFDAALTIFLLLDPGITTVIGRELPSNPESSFNFLFSVIKIQLLCAVLIIPLFFFGFEIFGTPSDFSVFPTVLIAIGAFSTAVSSPFKAILRSTGKANWEAIMRVIDRLLLATGYVLIHQSNGSLVDYCSVIAIAPSISAVIIISLAIIHSIRIQSAHSVTKDIDYHPRIILTKALPFFIFIALLQIMERADKLILYAHSPVEHISTYGIALLVYFTGMAVTRIIRNILLPWFSECDDSSPGKLALRYKTAFVFVCFLIPLGTIAAQLVMMTVPIVVFPEEYVYPDHELFSSESIFRVLLVGWSIQMVLSPSWESIRSHSTPMKLNITAFVGVFTAISFGMILIPIWGVYGAALMTIVAPLSFLLVCHIFMPEEILSNLEAPYYQTLITVIIISSSPTIFFIDSITPLSGFLLLIFLSSISAMVVYRYWNKLKVDLEDSEIKLD